MIRVLFADDDQWILDAMQYVIDWKSCGFDVIGTAANGRDAYELIVKNHPDVIFTDIVMPGMTGLELLKKLMMEKTDIEVIILTGYSEFKYAQEACRWGAFDYILKPVEVENLMDTLERVKEKIDVMKSNEEVAVAELQPLPNSSNQILTAILKYMNENIEEDLHLYRVAENFHFNPSYISQLFKKELGVSYSEFLTRIRMNAAEKLLLETDMPIKSVCDKTGIYDYFYFNKLIKKYKGLTPNQIRKKVNNYAKP